MSSTDTALSGRSALITGAQHGIGAATAKALAELGADVFVHYFRTGVPAGTLEPSEPGEELNRWRQSADADPIVTAIRRRGRIAAAHECDLADPSTIPTLFDEAEMLLGPIDILVNNAAVGGEDTFVPTGGVPSNEHVGLRGLVSQPLTAAGHDRFFAVNSRASALTMAEFARRHAERSASWGRIVNVSTDGAYCFPGEVSYGASKAALEALSRSAAKELGQYGVTVNTVSPGPIQTGYIPRELQERVAAATPLGRIGEPEDVADVIAFLATDQARWVTGQLIHVGGGHAT